MRFPSSASLRPGGTRLPSLPQTPTLNIGYRVKAKTSIALNALPVIRQPPIGENRSAIPSPNPYPIKAIAPKQNVHRLVSASRHPPASNQRKKLRFPFPKPLPYKKAFALSQNVHRIECASRHPPASDKRKRLPLVLVGLICQTCIERRLDRDCLDVFVGWFLIPTRRGVGG